MVEPGKIALFKGIRETGSIAAAARQLGMNYKRAWYLDPWNKWLMRSIINIDSERRVMDTAADSDGMCGA